MIQYEDIGIPEAKSAYRILFNTFKEHLKCSDKEAATAVSIAVDVCRSCWEREAECQCWNDE